MTHTQKAIELAIKGGFQAVGDGKITWQVVCFNTLFWQALGKALGWNKDKTFYEDRLTLVTWKREWHRLIDHLAEGKDIESYFKQLLS